MDPVIHFEMPYDDGDRLAEFYRSVFNWRINILGEEMNDYILAMTTESDEKGPKAPGAINGGFFPKSPESPAQTSVVISVEDIQESMAKVTDAGGEVLGEPMEIPGIGQYVAFNDSEGNRVGMLQPAAE